MRSELRHLFMRHRAYENRVRREEAHLIGIRNEIRGALGADPIEDPYAPAVSRQDEEELQAFKYRMQEVVDWDEDLTT